ncbi:nucleoside-diphosphate kinase [Enterococcus nangangensis]|uniref:nucleoside-diphosphate kinase n=1 Tax=Enterococcus nangangensis TaxID=2559926 RepID=UPI0010F76143|nr:nucleoside-diphosphate kinase [Enterococcus nangangensis]
MEQTLVIIKPDGVRRHLVGKILQRFEDKNLKIAALKYSYLTKEAVEEHYAHLKSRPFFPELIAYMTSGPVVCLVLESPAVIAIVRQLLGATQATAAVPGTIRGDYAMAGTENVVHASDSPAAAQAEIKRFFGEHYHVEETGPRFMKPAL